MAKKVKEIEVEDNNDDQVINPEDVLVENEKKDQKKRVFDEIKAFLILALIGIILVGGGTYWYKHIYKDSKDEAKTTINDEMGHKYISYETAEGNYLKVLNNKYVILSDETSVLKVMDLDLNVLYENEVAFDGYFIATDGNLYFYKEDLNEDEYSNTIELYRLENDKLIEVKTLHKDNVYYRIIYKDNGNEEVVGYSGVNAVNPDEDTKNYVYLLNGKEYELNDISLVSSQAVLSVDEPLYINNDKYMAYIDENGKYGIYNIVDNAKVVEASYDNLYVDKNNNNFIAIKGDKAGVINASLKKIVDYNYDFIDVNDGFYVVSKDNKLALMDNNYKLITNFEFDYQDVLESGYFYNECGGLYNTFVAYKINDKYLLVTNYNDLTSEEEYPKHEAYLIDSTGKYDVIKENAFDVLLDDNIVWLYDKDKMEYTFYDLDFKELYKLDFKNYDYDKEPSFKIVYGTLMSNFLKSNLYYDLKTGESLEKAKDFEEKVLDDVIIKMNGESKNTKVYLKDKVIFEYKYDFENDYKLYNKVDDNKIIYYDEHTYFMIRKDE